MGTILYSFWIKENFPEERMKHFHNLESKNCLKNFFREGGRAVKKQYKTTARSNQRDKDTSEKLDDEDFPTSHPLFENKWNSSFKGWCRRLPK